MTQPSQPDRPRTARLVGPSRENAAELIAVLAHRGRDDPAIAARLGLTPAQVAGVRREHGIPPGTAADTFSPTAHCVACKSGEHTLAEHRADREPLPPPLDPPPVDPAKAAATVEGCWRSAAAVIRQSWPGPSWAPDRSAAGVSWRVRVCAEAGLDVTPLYDEWQARYLAYWDRGGRARFRSVGRPLPPSARR